MSPAPWTLVELCAGSAALSYHMLGATGYQISPYQGTKWPLRKKLAAQLAAAGFEGPPAVVELSDPSYWGAAHADILCPERRAHVIAHLCGLVKRDPREVYDDLNGAAMGEGPGVATAEFLYLSRLAFSGKAVGTKGNLWKPQGFNKSSARGTPATDKFGGINPMIPSLIRTLSRLKLTPAEHRTRRGTARPPDGFRFRTVCYIDGPYSNTTAYPDGDLPRAEVVSLAMVWRAAGAHVLVSEGEAIPELVDAGWGAVRLQKGKTDKAKFRGKQEEWLTISRSKQ